MTRWRRMTHPSRSEEGERGSRSAGERALRCHVVDGLKRETRCPLLPGAIAEFNRSEFSRPIARRLHEAGEGLPAHRAVPWWARAHREHQRCW